MLKNISPLLTPELLFGLAKLGHGDDVALVDANFPADRVAEQEPQVPQGTRSRSPSADRDHAYCRRTCCRWGWRIC